MDKDNKKGIALILGAPLKKNKTEDKEDNNSDSVDYNEQSKSAVKSIIDAVKSENADKLRLALQNFLHAEKHTEEDTEDKEEDGA